MSKYNEIYSIICEKILNNEYKSGDKIPSVRKAAEIYGVSITTIQSAYFELCADGYIIAQEKSGYYVSGIARQSEAPATENLSSSIKYNLSGGVADSECFDIKLWQRYIKSALRQEDRLLSYSQARGEYDLRCAIAEYIKEKRNVVTSPDKIIIGAGIQPLLHILCSLTDKGISVSFPDKSFVQGIGIFNDYGFDVHTRDKDADIIYVSPSHMTRWGDVMPIKRRLELVEYSSKNNSLVIEDDYENEFLYNVKPTPSLYALGKGNIVYLGSFSAMLIPSIRISFMVLTDSLAREYKKKEHRYAQTAGKAEQIALCNYIRDGHIKSQTRKISRLYSAKTKQFYNLLKDKLPGADIKIGENTLQVILKVPFSKNTDIFEKHGLKVFIERYENDEIVLVLSPAGIRENELDNVTNIIKNAIVN